MRTNPKFLVATLFFLNLLPSGSSFADIDQPDYPRIFKKARELYIANPANPGEQKKTAKKVPESVVVQILQNDPSKLNASNEQLLLEVEKESRLSSDPTKHLRLLPPKGQPGYSNLQFYASHDYLMKGRTVPKSDLVAIWKNFLNQAKKQIILNVFDFDLEDVATLLAKKAQSGVSVRVGIDKGVINARPEVKKVRDLLSNAGVMVTEVASVGLNHQKVAAIDWEDTSKSQVLLSSGNLTQSCLGADGDLKDIPYASRPKNSIPNANHVITMKSWLLANLIQHELTKTLDPKFAFRGSQYPTTGSYQITGPGVPPETFDAYPEHSFVITFSPGGGYRSINKNLIAHFIRKSTGPIRMIQFAYSSADVATALREKAVSDLQSKRSFDFKSVGDTPFAMQGWSQFLKMSGLEQVKDADGSKHYVESPENFWNRELDSEQMKKLRENVRIAPIAYRNTSVTVNGKSYDLSAKIHHKVLSAAPFVIVGTSFNFSEGAETNNEQIVVFRDPELVQFANGMAEWLIAKSPGNVYNEAQRRNKMREMDEDADPNSSELKKTAKPKKPNQPSKPKKPKKPKDQQNNSRDK